MLRLKPLIQAMAVPANLCLATVKMLSLTADNMFHAEESSMFIKQDGPQCVPNLDRKSLARELPQCLEGKAVP